MEDRTSKICVTVVLVAVVAAMTLAIFSMAQCDQAIEVEKLKQGYGTTSHTEYQTGTHRSQ